jgi:hypothetical protein
MYILIPTAYRALLKSAVIGFIPLRKQNMHVEDETPPDTCTQHTSVRNGGSVHALAMSPYPRSYSIRDTQQTCSTLSAERTMALKFEQTAIATACKVLREITSHKTLSCTENAMVQCSSCLQVQFRARCRDRNCFDLWFRTWFRFRSLVPAPVPGQDAKLFSRISDSTRHTRPTQPVFRGVHSTVTV